MKETFHINKIIDLPFLGEYRICLTNDRGLEMLVWFEYDFKYSDARPVVKLEALPRERTPEHGTLFTFETAQSLNDYCKSQGLCFSHFRVTDEKYLTTKKQ